MDDLQPNNILIYRADDDRLRLEVKLENQTIWLSQKQIVELYQKGKATISEHIKHIFEDGELDKNSVVRNFRTTAADGKNYNIAPAKRKIPMRMIDWIKKLDGFLELNERNILEHAGKISHEMALQVAGKEYEKYCEIQKKAISHFESDFDKAVKQLMEKGAPEDSEFSKEPLAAGGKINR